MLYFSKIRIFFIILVSLFFISIASSNFLKTNNIFFNKKINLGLDLQGGSYLLLEIDNKPIEIQKLQNTTTINRNYFKKKKLNFTDLRIQDNSILFNVSEANVETAKSFFLDKESEINPFYNQYKSHQFDLNVSGNKFEFGVNETGWQLC